MKKRMYKSIIAILLAMNISILPVCASTNLIRRAEARYNNIFSAELTLGFDMNNVAYCCISISPYLYCTGLEGHMRLLDANGNWIQSWNITDYSEPYQVEKTWQVEYGKTYILTFQGYAFGEGTMFDDIVLSVTATCTD